MTVIRTGNALAPGMLLVYNKSKVEDCWAFGTVTSGRLYAKSASSALNYIATQANKKILRSPGGINI